jgi:hypothetical protein
VIWCLAGFRSHAAVGHRPRVGWRHDGELWLERYLPVLPRQAVALLYHRVGTWGIKMLVMSLRMMLVTMMLAMLTPPPCSVVPGVFTAASGGPGPHHRAQLNSRGDQCYLIRVRSRPLWGLLGDPFHLPQGF